VAQYSHSKLSCYLQCPKKYEFRYIQGIQPPSRTIELHLGSVVHETLRKLYADLQIPKLNSQSEILEFYNEQWNATLTPSTRVVRTGTTARDYLESGREMVSRYYTRFHPFNQVSTIGVEMEISFPLAGADSFQGVIDRISNASEGRVEIHDYKTARRLPSLDKVRSDTQLALYEVAIRHRWPDTKDVSLVWHYLAHEKEIRDTKTPNQLEAARQHALRTIAKIESASSFPTSVSPLCDWCEYQSICPAMRAPALPPRQNSDSRTRSHSTFHKLGHRPYRKRARAQKHRNSIVPSLRFLGSCFDSIVRWLRRRN